METSQNLLSTARSTVGRSCLFDRTNTSEKLRPEGTAMSVSLKPLKSALIRVVYGSKLPAIRALPSPLTSVAEVLSNENWFTIGFARQ